MICSTYEKYHTFTVPVEGEPFARQCACGERQPKVVNTGLGVTFSDVLIDRDDLRKLLDAYGSHSYDYDLDLDDRIEDLLSRA